MPTLPWPQPFDYYYHHCRPFAYVQAGVVCQARLTRIWEEPDCRDYCTWDHPWCEQNHFETAYEWLAQRCGFWPLFLAVGNQEDDLRLTGYDWQFRRKLPEETHPLQRRLQDEQRNLVLFSWRLPPHRQVVYSDHDNWHMVLNSVRNKRGGGVHDLEVASDEPWTMKPRWERSVLRPSWPASRWLAQARRRPGSVQAVVPELDLASADLITCRNQRTFEQLVAMGFERTRIQVARLRVFSL